LSLVRFGDATGRPQIVALLQPARLTAPGAGHVMDSDRAGTAIHQGGLIAQLKLSDSPQPGQPAQTIEIRTPIPGRIRSVAQTGAKLAAGAEIAVIDPGSDQIWEALRALFLVGQIDDIPAILPYERDLPEISDRVRQQAALTEKAIRERAK